MRRLTANSRPQLLSRKNHRPELLPAIRLHGPQRSPAQQVQSGDEEESIDRCPDRLIEGEFDEGICFV